MRKLRWTIVLVLALMFFGSPILIADTMSHDGFKHTNPVLCCLDVQFEPTPQGLLILLGVGVITLLIAWFGSKKKWW